MLQTVFNKCIIIFCLLLMIQMRNYEEILLWEGRDDVVMRSYFAYTMVNTEPRPAVIVLPGGAYAVCDSGGFEGDSVAMSFAADGYQAFVLEYSVVAKAPAGHAKFPAQMHDVAKAIMTIREHSGEWGIDTDKIFIAGFSAGAHLAAMYSTSWHRTVITDRFGLDKEYFRIAGSIMMYGMSDYSRLIAELNESELETEDELNRLLIGDDYNNPAELAKWSPEQLASDKTPPMFIGCAVDDKIVNPMHSVRMAVRLHELGVPYELHMFELGGHAFGLGRNVIKPYRDDMNRACGEWISLAKTFLLHRISESSVKKDSIRNM